MHWKKWTFGTLGALVVLALGTWKLSNLRGYQVFGEIVDRVETEERVVALTFDDGPSPANTEAVLRLLASHHVKATFFMVGRNIESHPELAVRVLAEGHEVGNHSYSHERLVFRAPATVEAEITRTDALLRQAGAKGDIPFRAPFGKKLLVLPWVLQRLGKTDVLFDVVPDDHATQDADLIARRVLDGARPGSIILLHDGWAAKPGTLEAAGRVLEALQARGYHFVTVSQLLARRGEAR